MFSLRIVPEFWLELQEMSVFYERKSIGLGDRFLNDFDSTLIRLKDNPFAYFNLKNNKRRISFKTFQCMLIYEIKGSIIEVQVLKDFRTKPSKNI
jgi:hypothetical protein